MSLRTVLTGPELARALRRIAHEILEANSGSTDLLLLGIPTRGVTLAARIANELEQIEGKPVAHGSLDITMYRDDLAQRQRALASTNVALEAIDDRVVVLVDDVLFSGRSVRAALNALADLGRPRQIKLAVVVDRGHRELPIRPDFVGKNLPTALDERVAVRLEEHDGEDCVVISK